MTSARQVVRFRQGPPEVEGGQANLAVYDILGKLVITRQMSGKTVNFIDLADLLPGIYIVKVSDQKETVYKGKLIKQE